MNRLMLDYKPTRQGKAEFNPSPEMIAFADAYIESRRNISVACLAAGDLSGKRNIYYARPHGWRWNEDFATWLNEYCKKWVLRNVGMWYLIALKEAEKGSYHHLEMLMQIAKEFTKPNGLSINISGDNMQVHTPHAVIFSSVKNG